MKARFSFLQRTLAALELSHAAARGGARSAGAAAAAAASATDNAPKPGCLPRRDVLVACRLACVDRLPALSACLAHAAADPRTAAAQPLGSGRSRDRRAPRQRFSRSHVHGEGRGHLALGSGGPVHGDESVRYRPFVEALWLSCKPFNAGALAAWPDVRGAAPARAADPGRVFAAQTDAQLAVGFGTLGDVGILPNSPRVPAEAHVQAQMARRAAAVGGGDPHVRARYAELERDVARLDARGRGLAPKRDLREAVFRRRLGVGDLEFLLNACDHRGNGQVSHAELLRELRKRWALR